MTKYRTAHEQKILLILIDLLKRQWHTRVYDRNLIPMLTTAVASEANRGTRLGKILSNTVDFYFFYHTDNIRRFHTADFVQRTVCSPQL